MIKLFIADLDGCISYPFQAPEWSAITTIRLYNEQAKKEAGIPELTLCTGRPLPYVEAIAQWLDVKLPIIFESGGGIYNTVTNEIKWSSEYEKHKDSILEIRKWVESDIIPKYPGMMQEFAKKTDVGIVHPDFGVINKVYPKIKEYVQSNFSGFDVHYTEVSVNVILEGSNKGTGVLNLSTMLDISTDAMAYIGDGTNDIPALKLVKFPFAPKNCRNEVTSHAEVIAKEATKAVSEVYDRLIIYNTQFDKQ